MRLTIISHTPHYQTSDGGVSGWGPTVREINHLAGLFSEIIHLAPLLEGEAPKSSLAYVANVRHVPLRASGGKSFLDKAGVLKAAIYNSFIIWRCYREEGWFHLRAPANIMFYALPLLKFSGVKHCWIKFAGSWRDLNIPLTYRWQRHWLRNNFNSFVVTVNGRLPDDPPHVLGFENPCLSISEIEDAKLDFSNKDYTGKIQICFVGQLEPGKGVMNLLEGILPLDAESKVHSLHVIGDGSLRGEVEAISNLFKNIQVHLHGYLQRHEINLIYANSHINILPSESEGFPKVIAEGAAYGAIPVVTNISSLSEYINNSNGRLLTSNNPEQIRKTVKELILMNGNELKLMASNALELSKQFTYERYSARIIREIVGLENIHL
ncbi:MAG: hypothetical protein KIPDCIKN_03894 [Haliscomenobacter sp.]|nr:hypothetical protein [Haliscomenobacter sp.]